MKIEVSAKTIEKAVEEGLKQLNASIEDVDVKVISEGGLFKKAKIEMTLNTTKTLTDTEQVEEIVETDVETQTVEQNSTLEKEPDTDDNKELETKIIEEQVDTKEVLENIVKTSASIENELTEDERQQRKAELIEKTVELATEWLNGLVYAYNVNAEVEVLAREHDVYANIKGENLGVLIGYHGEAMESIQHLLNTYLYSKLRGAKRVFVDVSGYRNKRCEDLKELARKIGNKVLESKRSYRLDPMNSFERRIIHEELSQTAHLLTHSEGVDPNRYLIIEYTEEI